MVGQCKKYGNSVKMNVLELYFDNFKMKLSNIDAEHNSKQQKICRVDSI